MGADIHGWVEVVEKQWPNWQGVVKIDWLVHRSYFMFSSLFGVRSRGEFRPIAPGRGVPPLPSEETDRERYVGAVAATWITWSELAAINWDEEEDADAFTHEPEYRARRRKDYLIG